MTYHTDEGTGRKNTVIIGGFVMEGKNKQRVWDACELFLFFYFDGV